ncbi:hypothetical protein WJX84_003450 [Apatococcus fuscideae]|uniref:BZIP domain-containing protein n=1 Tax=Apatococcus fuscideae TaxID=2026836 RepID=A0AAW1SNJ1_9CHLO
MSRALLPTTEGSHLSNADSRHRDGALGTGQPAARSLSPCSLSPSWLQQQQQQHLPLHATERQQLAAFLALVPDLRWPMENDQLPQLDAPPLTLSPFHVPRPREQQTLGQRTESQRPAPMPSPLHEVPCPDKLDRRRSPSSSLAPASSTNTEDSEAVGDEESVVTRRRTLNRDASARARARRHQHQAALEAELVSRRQAEHTAKGLPGTLDPAALLDAMLRRTADADVDIYDIPLLAASETAALPEQPSKKRSRTPGVRDLSIIPEEMSEGHSPRAIGEEQPGLEPHLDQGDPAVMAASLHPVSTDVHIPGPGGGAEVPCNQSQADASIRGATQELRSAQAAVALKLRQALSDQAPIEVLWPLTDEALTLLRTATLLRKDLLSGTAEASFKLKDGLLCESEVWSTPAVFADLESWRQLLVHTDTLLQSMLEGFTCLTDPRHYAAAILATTETSLQLTQLRVPWVHQPARSLSLMDMSRPISGLDPSSHH